MRQFSLKNERVLLLGLVIVSAVLSFLRMPILHGTFAALILTVVTQLYLPGWLLARTLGKHQHPNFILRFAWVLMCGLSLTVIIGAVARLVNLPVAVYLLILHGVMLVLIFLPKVKPTTDEHPLPKCSLWERLALYGLVAISCVVVLGVSYESRARFYGFEDQPIFISLIDWMATHPETRPNDLPLRSRQIGVLNGDTRMDTDGWSYNHAAWVWVSGVTATQLIWYDLGALFVWVTPLLAFALAYELTGRAWAGAFSAAALAIAGLVTTDNIVYNPTYTAYGRFVVFQINTLRQMSIAIMLPLALLAGLNFLRTFSRGGLIMTLLAGMAVASMHPTQTMTLVLALGGTVALRWLTEPNLKNLRRLLPLAVVLILLLALPFVQRLNRVGLNAADSVVSEARIEAAEDNVIGYDFLVLRDVPLIGTTFIRNPAAVFYSPVIVLTVIIGLLFALRWRTLTGAYLFSTTLLAMLLFFTPGLTALFNGVASSVGVLTTMFLLPVAQALGLGFEKLLNLIAVAFSRRNTASGTKSRGLLYASGAVATIIGMGVLIYEPIPFEGSPRDQLIAYNDMQAQRYLHPSQAAVIERLGALIPDDAITVMLTPYAISNLVIEDVSGALITGGRLNRNIAYEGSTRFFNEAPPYAPWLDTADELFLERFGVTHIVVQADTTRLPQLLLQPERFVQLDETAGYFILEVKASQSDDADALFERMNAIYSETDYPRWTAEGFNLILPGDAARWQPFVDEWQTMLEDNPEDERARLGLAFSLTMSGDDSAALAAWQDLNAQQPDIFLYADAVAATTQQIDATADALAPLLAQLRSDDAARRVLAARRLLTEQFFYRLNPETLDEIISVTEADSLIWDGLANLGKMEMVRARAGLLINSGRYATAQAWLATIPRVEWSPEDVNAMAALDLAVGDVDNALNLLQRATEPDWLKSNDAIHPDRWANNISAQMYYLLRGGFAAQDGRSEDARAAYQAAIDAGAGIAGRYFLAQMLADGDEEKARLLQEAAALWAEDHDSELPPLISPITLRDAQNITINDPTLKWDMDESAVYITADYGDFQPFRAFPAQLWHAQLISPDGAMIYGASALRAEVVPGTLSRMTIPVPPEGNIATLTPALIYIQAMYNEAVTSAPVIVPVVLNRPTAAVIPPTATNGALTFGESITLEAYTVEREGDALNVTLYWKADAPLAEDYQVFVHVLDDAGETAAQRDVTPVDNRYPTSQWRTETTIEDAHTLTLPDLSAGTYRVLVGLYKLPDGERLIVNPAEDERVGDGYAVLGELEIIEQ